MVSGWILSVFCLCVHSLKNLGPSCEAKVLHFDIFHRIWAVLWLRRSGGSLSLRGPAFNPRLGRVRLWWIEWHWDRFFSQYFSFLCQYHSANVPLTFIYRFPTLWMPLNDTHLEPIVNQATLMRAVPSYFLKIHFNVVRFEVPRTVSLNITVLLDVESCELTDRYKLFEWNCYPRLQIIEVAPLYFFR